MVLDALKFAFGWLVPAPDAPPLWVYLHRLFVGAVIVGILVILRSWNDSWMPNFEAVARASQVAGVEKVVNDRMDRVNARQDGNDLVFVKTQLQQGVVDACDAIDKREQRRLDSANSNISVLADRYYDLTKREFNKPPCSDITVNWQDNKNRK